MTGSFKKPPARAAAGMTLIEVGIAMVVVGLIMVPILNNYGNYLANRRINDTQSSFTAIESAIQYYYSTKTSLPCPARPDLTSSNPAYGTADCVNTTIPGNPSFLSGAIPFATLNLPESDSLDGWSNKIAYTVGQLNTGAYASGNPTVQFQSMNSDGTKTAGTSVPYVLVSYGADGLGGYSSSAVKLGACPASTVRESQNCNLQNNPPTFLDTSNARSLVPGNNYYDDLIAHPTNMSTQIWAYDGRPNISTNDWVGIATQNPTSELDVGGSAPVGGTNPTVSASVFVNGTVQATYLATYQNGAAANSFPISHITGTGANNTPTSAPDGMGAGITPIRNTTSACGTSATPAAMSAIAGGDATCGGFVLPYTGTSCASGLYVNKLTHTNGAATGAFVCGQ